MAIEVRIPTILRTYTIDPADPVVDPETGRPQGKKVVVATGACLAELIGDLESQYPGIKERLIDVKDGKDDLRRFVNVYINDEDVRFIGGLQAELKDGDQVVVLPAVAGGSQTR